MIKVPLNHEEPFIFNHFIESISTHKTINPSRQYMNYMITFALLICSGFTSFSTHAQQTTQSTDKSTSSLMLIHSLQGYSINNHADTGAPVVNEFSTVVIENGRFVAVGNETLVKAYPQATKIDAKGQMMLPGLIDAHGHMLNLGLNMLRVDLRGTPSLQDAQSSIADYAKNNPELDWLVGRGWNQVLWPTKQFPTAADLDQIESKRPIMLNRVDGHATWVNSIALKLAGIDDHTPDPAGGIIQRDSNGKATGILIDNAMELIKAVKPAINEATMTKAITLAQQRLLSEGITSMHDAGITAAEYHLYKKLAQQQALSVKVYAMLNSEMPELESIIKQGKISLPNLTVRSVKGVADGALGSRGAALIEDYSDKPGHKGLLMLPKKRLDYLNSFLSQHGFQLNVHAIGDQANKTVLDSFQDQLTAEQRVSLRPRIEHAQVVQVSDIPRFKKLGVIASMQPVHATSDMNMAGDRVGEQRLQGAYAWRAYLKQGTIMASGSDFPVELSNPWHGLYAAVTRQNQQQQPTDGWRPQDKMSLMEALRSFTLDAAYAAFMEKEMGSIEVGKQADFILLEKNIFKQPVQALWNTKVAQTWVDGNLVFESK
jgi:predicted amidohydrolase YtcJ